MRFILDSKNPYFTLYADGGVLQAIHLHESNEVLSFALQGQPVAGAEVTVLAGRAPLAGVGEFLLTWFSLVEQRSVENLIGYARLDPERDCEYVWSLKPLKFIEWLSATTRRLEAKEPVDPQCLGPVLRRWCDDDIDEIIMLAGKYGHQLNWADGYFWISDSKWALCPDGFMDTKVPDLSDFEVVE